jgi:hypothetical protein
LVCPVRLSHSPSDFRTLALHPYFKLAYIKLAWGGAKEQEEERKAGNPFAKNWQDEAQQILENTVRVSSSRLQLSTLPTVL